ncbi:MAG: NAD(P)-dependent oxidoreductase [Pseudomonadota bacterium]
MHVGFIGLGNLGAKLAGTLVRNALEVTVLDRDHAAMAPLLAQGAAAGETPRALAQSCDAVITCLPSPAASEAVLSGPEGLESGIKPGSVWLEMSTTDAALVRDQASRIEAAGAHVLECPVSGGCHRAATGNISIFAGGSRAAFDAALPLLRLLGRRILHTGPLGSASELKVMTNYLATLHLVGLAEALTVMHSAGHDMATTYEAIRISSGNSFVHETESQVILNGSRDINFTMDLVLKDIGLFQGLADQGGVPLTLSPNLVSLFRDAIEAYGPRENSPNIVRRYEDATGLSLRATGFPAEISDDEPEMPGYEVKARR